MGYEQVEDVFEPLVRPILPRLELEFLHGDPNQKPPVLRYTPDEPDNPDWVADDVVKQVAAFHSLAAFVDYMWPVLHPGRPFKRGPHVDVVCFALEQLAYGRIEGHELVICVPPRMLKSVIVNIMFPAWIWLHSPQKIIMGISGSENVAKRDNRKMRDVITSDQYRRLLRTGVELQKRHGVGLATEWTLEKDQNEKQRFENTAKGQRYALASGSKITGEGMDLQIVDDPVDAKEAMEGSMEQMMERMATSVSRYNGVWSTRMQDPGKSARVVIMQRLHEADLAGVMLARGVASIVLPMEFDPNHPNLCSFDWRKETGSLLLPAHYSAEHLKKMASEEGGLGAYGYASQFQQSPSPVGGGMFPVDGWGYYSEPPTQLARMIIQKGGRVVGSLDCASKSGYSNAFSVAVVVGFLDDAMFVLDVYRDKVTLPGLVDMYETMRSEWGSVLSDVYIEDASNGTALLQLKESDGCIAVHPQAHGGKEVRAGHTARYHRRGRAMLSAMRAWAETLVSEHGLFPNGTYADIVDALAQACMLESVAAQKKATTETMSDKFSWLAQFLEMDPQLRDLWQ